MNEWMNEWTNASCNLCLFSHESCEYLKDIEIIRSVLFWRKQSWFPRRSIYLNFWIMRKTINIDYIGRIKIVFFSSICISGESEKGEEKRANFEWKLTIAYSFLRFTARSVKHHDLLHHISSYICNLSRIKWDMWNFSCLTSLLGFGYLVIEAFETNRRESNEFLNTKLSFRSQYEQSRETVEATREVCPTVSVSC